MKLKTSKEECPKKTVKLIYGIIITTVLTIMISIGCSQGAAYFDKKSKEYKQEIKIYNEQVDYENNYLSSQRYRSISRWKEIIKNTAVKEKIIKILEENKCRLESIQEEQNRKDETSSKIKFTIISNFRSYQYFVNAIEQEIPFIRVNLEKIQEDNNQLRITGKITYNR